ncbi:hypothetical protein H7K45_27655 [Mycobacterium yunnanensis]|uniref:Minor tail protein gp31 C-terminal domain-containing protein n=1 Tax=Mycobacterium yunnanensis TaxID=368477 RepID=A0A9X3C3F9_9MYCO|nr:hypothetical protein [Mycobacterium yunnanensis]
MFIDLNADPGERFAPEVREEIAEVAPSTVTNGSISTAKLAEDAVTMSKIALAAVGSEQLDAGAVDTLALGAESVTTSKLAADAVTPPKCGTGVVTAVDNDGNAIEWTEWYGTAAQFAAIAVKDPNVVYNVTA